MSTAVLLVHGFLTGPDDWDGLLPKLTNRYDEVSVFCQPGHARADEKEKVNYKLFTHSASYKALEAELDRLFAAHEFVDVVGHSMGGAMSVWAAANYPVRRLCLLAPAFKFLRFGIFVKSAFYRSKRRKFKKAKITSAYAEALSAENDRYFNDYKDGRKILFSRLLPNWTPHNLSVLYLNVKKGQRCIKNIKCPVEILWGSFDEFVPASSVKAFMKRMVSADMTFINYGNLGHSMMLSLSKELVFRDVLAFLDSEPVEDIKPENPGEERTVLHILTVDKQHEKYRRIITYSTGSRMIGGAVELIEEKSTKILPY